MIEVDVQAPSTIKTEKLIQQVEQAFSQYDLTCTLKGTLASYPGCVHWHFKKGREAGTLELTWWEAERRLWFKVGDHRTAPWIEKAIPYLKKQLETSFS